MNSLGIGDRASYKKSSMQRSQVMVNGLCQKARYSLYVLAETELGAVKQQVVALRPDVLIVDSVQILYNKDIASTPGSVTQVKEVAMQMMEISKTHRITTFLVGHVTKGGELAGPKVLEHLVDTVFEFEGDRQSGYRIIRSIKNRFGTTDDIAIFQMEKGGLVEVVNPSEAFLEQRMRGATGSVVIPTLEGTRPLLVEVQALVSVTSFSTPSRRSTGFDPKRLNLLLAVLEKKMRFVLHDKDVFVSITGGLRLSEPAVDLGVIVAIASSEKNIVANPFAACVGEVGLSGEVRAVPRIESRIKEAINLGFKKMILPSQNLKGISKELSQKIELEGVVHIGEAINKLLNCSN
ncbi:MAG: DNA repair protein RadA [Simkaniaceae bacterium]|nr:DNA repair protein RadA [Simkaniaceae bacterium]